ncbi:hypothetical protein DFS33DRAFT_1373969 [Desarmillaria ectypa]|nr:hypothetical protein DFS33DRAFT_1373969 [Desarmillaria ectypa]
MTERKDLSSRIRPQTVLPDVRNPLTAPLQLSGSTSSERACQRFAIEGNAIVTGGVGGALLEHGVSGISIFDVLASISSGKETITQLQVDFPRAKTCFAGVVGTTHAIDMDTAEWKRVLDINTTGSWICAQVVAKCMIIQKTGGSILFTASISGHRVKFPQPQVSYNVSKGAIVQLRSSLAAEWAQYGIRVNSISPEGRRIWCERNPMGRMGMPEELTGAIVLLCSKFAGRYITGADILVDGLSWKEKRQKENGE